MCSIRTYVRTLSTAAMNGLQGVCLTCSTRTGPVYKYDLSVPLADMYSLVETMRSRLAEFAGVQARTFLPCP